MRWSIKNEDQAFVPALHLGKHQAGRRSQKACCRIRDEAKGYIGQDVILAKYESNNQLIIVVGHLYDYGFFDSIPLGTAIMLGAAKFRVTLTEDEYQSGQNSWYFHTTEKLKEWASGNIPSKLIFEESALPVDSQMETIDGVVAIVPLQPGVKETYYEKANELFWINNEEIRS